MSEAQEGQIPAPQFIGHLKRRLTEVQREAETVKREIQDADRRLHGLRTREAELLDLISEARSFLTGDKPISDKGKSE